jgi:autophagy-related protein 33
MVGQGSSSSTSGGEEEEVDVNGEVVRKAVERQQVVENVKAGFWGLGFVLSVIGIWGDGA